MFELRGPACHAAPLEEWIRRQHPAAGTRVHVPETDCAGHAHNVCRGGELGRASHRGQPASSSALLGPWCDAAARQRPSEQTWRVCCLFDPKTSRTCTRLHLPTAPLALLRQAGAVAHFIPQLHPICAPRQPSLTLFHQYPRDQALCLSLNGPDTNQSPPSPHKSTHLATPCQSRLHPCAELELSRQSTPATLQHPPICLYKAFNSHCRLNLCKPEEQRSPGGASPAAGSAAHGAAIGGSTKSADRLQIRLALTPITAIRRFPHQTAPSTRGLPASRG